tara:strand:+ start:479 stop:1969 length:1491 start_codon:yes stop_codon:yes gene_type:complete
MADNIRSLTSLVKTSVAATDFIKVARSTGKNYKLALSTVFPSLATSGTSSEQLYVSVTNKNQLNFKGIKSGDTGLLTVATTSNNIVLTVLEAGIDLSLCNNATAGFLSGVDFTATVTGECAVTNGGTGLSTIAKGSVLYASAEDTLAAATPSANGQVLMHNATTGIPVWNTITGGTNINVVNTAGVITINHSLGSTMSSILDMANYNIDLGTGFISSDGSTSQGIRVTGAAAYIGATANYFNDDVLNIYGGGIRFGNSADVNIKPNATSSTTAGKKITISGGASAAAAAGDVEIIGGTASGSGDGGSIVLQAGRDTSGSSDGNIQLKTYTGGTATAALTIAPEGQNVTVNTGDLIMSAGNVYMRNSSNPDVIKYQGAPASTDDGTTTVSAANILTGIVRCTPTADRSKSFDSAANLISGLGLNVDGDAFDFSFINLATNGQDNVTLTDTADASNISLLGNMVIHAQDATDDAVSIGVGRFRIARTGSGAVAIYRIG